MSDPNIDPQDTRTLLERFVSSLTSANTVAGNLIAALWLIGWFAFCLTFIFFTMAAQEFQSKITEANGASKDTVGYVLNEVDELNGLRNSLAGAERVLSDRYGAVAACDERYRKAQTKAAESRSKLIGDVSELFAELPPTPKLLPIGGNDFTPDGFDKSIATAQNELFAATSYLATHHAPRRDPESSHPQDLLSTSQTDLKDLRVATESLRFEWDDRANDRIIASDQETKVKNWDLQIKAKSNPNQLTNDLVRYQSFFIGIPYAFVALPGIILTLVLTVLMGILGALISLARELVFEDKDPSIGQYLFRIGLGAAVALAVFFFAGAGALTLAQTSGADHGGVELSPYLVSFFGIVAGYLSKRVTQWMRETGARIFPVKDEADRWAIDLNGILSTHGTTAVALETATGITPEQMALWATRKEAVPLQAQTQIAAFVREPLYKLFTDIAPPP